MRRKINFLLTIALVVAIGMFSISCGEDEVVTVVETDTVFVNTGSIPTQEPNLEADALLSSAYARWRNTMYNHQNQVHGIAVWTGDLSMLPARGEDWLDGGRHQDLHTHSYIVDNATINEAWDDYFESLSASIVALEAYEAVPNPVLEFIGQAKALVAFNAYNLLINFGQVPFDRFNDGTNVELLTGADAVDAIDELYREAMEHMNSFESVPSQSNVVTEAAVWAMMAKLYLNKAFIIDPYGYTPASVSASDMDSVYKYTTKIIDLGTYSLESDYFRMFDVENAGNSEFILAVEQISSDNRDLGRIDLATNMPGRNQRWLEFETSGRGSNGGCITKSFFDMWDQTDPRFSQVTMLNSDGNAFDEEGFIEDAGVVEFNRGILHGQQYGPVFDEDAAYVTAVVGQDEDNNDILNIVIEALVMDKSAETLMDFTPEVSSLNLTEDQLNQGARISKYQVDAIGGRRTAGFDIPLIRLADIYLIRAEATLRGATTSSVSAADDVNTVRVARDGDVASGTATLGSITVDLDALLDERAFELYWEPHRRTDLIRFGEYESAWDFKTNSDVNKRLFPIPSEIVAAFSSLGVVQNTGY